MVIQPAPGGSLFFQSHVEDIIQAWLAPTRFLPVDDSYVQVSLAELLKNFMEALWASDGP